MSRRLLPLLALLALLVPLPAQAVDGIWRDVDPTGDVEGSAFSPEPPPCGTWTQPEVTTGDITRLDVRHRPGSLKVAVRLATTARSEGMQLSIPVKTDRQSYDVFVLEHKGRIRSDISEAPSPDEIEPHENECGNHFYGYLSDGVRCRIATAIAPRLLSVVIPRTCIGEPRWVRVGAELGGGDDVWHHDRWAPPGVEVGDAKPWIHTYGPRVRVSR